MPDSLPSSDVAYHVQFSIESYTPGDIQRAMSVLRGLDVPDALWPQYEEYVAEIPRGGKHLAGTLPFTSEEGAISMVEYLTSDLNKFAMLPIAGVLSVRKFQGEELVETVTTERL